ncbi:MAG: class I tRNA ligase family protein, partial [Desulfuromonadales bacterium]
GLKFMGEVPFKEVYIHALVRDAEGQKMSKSKGNVIDPLGVVEEYGADAFRFTLAAFASMGRDIKLSTERIAGYKAFANKLWNAARFALMNLEDFDPATIALEKEELSLADAWILARLAEATRETSQALAGYHYNEAASVLYAFTWNEFCDWYIELVKGDLYGDDPAARKRAQAVLFTVLEQLLRLLHPLMPFITEEIWQALPGKRPVASLMLASWPEAGVLPVDAARAQRMARIMDVVRGIRNIRGEMDVNPGKQIAAVLDCKSDEALAIMGEGERYLRALAKVNELTCGMGVERPKQAATQVAGDIEILVPLAGLIDLDEEEKRLQKEIAKVEKDVTMFEKKLANADFVARAPVEVLEKDRGKLADAQEKFRILQGSLERIRAMM